MLMKGKGEAETLPENPALDHQTRNANRTRTLHVLPDSFNFPLATSQAAPSSGLGHVSQDAVAHQLQR